MLRKLTLFLLTFAFFVPHADATSLSYTIDFSSDIHGSFKYDSEVPAFADFTLTWASFPTLDLTAAMNAPTVSNGPNSCSDGLDGAAATFAFLSGQICRKCKAVVL